MQIETERLAVRLGDTPVLHDLTCTLQSGELLGLIGPNGSGKSTLLRAMAGVLPAHAWQGGIRLAGRPLSRLTPQARARQVAWLPQNPPVHWPLSVERVVALGRLPHQGGWSGTSLFNGSRLFRRQMPRSPDDHSAATDPDTAAIDRAIATMTLEHLRDRRITTLSGGEQMRTLLARALAVEAPVLLADEPTASLDLRHQLQVMDALRHTCSTGNSVIVALHDLSLAARYCDRLLLLHQGHLVADGPPEQVLTAERIADVYAVETRIDMQDGRPSILLPPHIGKPRE